MGHLNVQLVIHFNKSRSDDHFSSLIGRGKIKGSHHAVDVSVERVIEYDLPACIDTLKSVVHRFESRESLLYLCITEPQLFGYQYRCGQVHRIESAQNAGRITNTAKRKTCTFKCRFYLFYDILRSSFFGTYIHIFFSSESMYICFGFDPGTLMYPSLFKSPGLQDLHLRITDVLHRSEVLYMGRAYLSYHHILRIDKGCDLSDVPLASCTHLNDIDFRIVRQVVIDIFHHTAKGIDRAGCGVGSVFGFQQMFHIVFDACFAVTCGDPYHDETLHRCYLLLCFDLKSVKEHLLNEE